MGNIAKSFGLLTVLWTALPALAAPVNISGTRSIESVAGSRTDSLSSTSNELFYNYVFSTGPEIPGYIPWNTPYQDRFQYGASASQFSEFAPNGMFTGYLSGILDARSSGPGFAGPLSYESSVSVTFQLTSAHSFVLQTRLADYSTAGGLFTQQTSFSLFDVTRGTFVGTSGTVGRYYDSTVPMAGAYYDSGVLLAGTYRIEAIASGSLTNPSSLIGSRITSGSFNFDLGMEEYRHAMAIPEPETWLMLLAGLGILGWSRRRSPAASR